MDKPLTVTAQRVLQLADTYARAEGCEYTGTDHLLLGMLHQEDSVAAAAFERIGVKLAEVASHLHFEPIDLDGTALLSEERPRNFAVRESLKRARAEAERLKDKYIGTEHILLGMLASPQNEAMRMLAGVSPLLGGLRDEVLHLLGQREEPARGEAVKASEDRIGWIRKHVAAMPPAIQGYEGARRAMTVAHMLMRLYRLDEETAYPLFAEWNASCEPPWGEADLRRMLARAEGQFRARESATVPAPSPAAATVPVDPHADAFDLIRAELAYQIKATQGYYGTKHEIGTWLLLTRQQLAEATEIWNGTDDCPEAIHSLIRALVCGVACLDQHGEQVIQDVAQRIKSSASVEPGERKKAWAPHIEAILARRKEANHAAAQAG